MANSIPLTEADGYSRESFALLHIGVVQAFAFCCSFLFVIVPLRREEVPMGTPHLDCWHFHVISVLCIYLLPPRVFDTKPLKHTAYVSK